ncbi:uncharacterized protein SAMN05661086_00628 [Anaeromicropila populeti]|uniref:TPM domain-containing protein n=2 Tax=Anaeromicropila populeti TaxID=37658 RepID=A0A1I6IAT0_9FIRM|nr:uncharacterized protein SAMN05661086_00628 [Anaeromicropila populeti]
MTQCSKHFPVRILVLLLLLFVLGCPIKISAESTDIQKVYDTIDLFGNDAEELENYLNEKSLSSGFDIIVITEDSITYSEQKEYLEDFADTTAYSSPDCVLMLLNLNPQDSGYEIQGYGKAEDYITNSRIDQIVDDIYNNLKQHNYVAAIKHYADKVEKYSSKKPGAPTAMTYLLMLAISMGISAVVVGIMVFNSGGRMTTSFNTYLNPQNSRILARRDRYVHTTVTKTKIERSSGNGGGHGGISAGGRSHSGGGRRL